MKPLAKLLDHSFEQREIPKNARAWQALNRWPEIVGEALAQKSWPDRFQQGTVYVATAGPAWAQELRMRKDQILERIAGFLGDRSLVKDVRFGTRPLPERAAVVTLSEAEGPKSKIEDFHALKQKILSRAEENA